MDKIKLREKLYLPTLSFLEFATNNFIRGNYKIGLDGYVRFKRNLGI